MSQKSERVPNSSVEFEAGNATQFEARRHLLARVAGSVASGIVGAPSEGSTTAAAVAEIAVDIADEILKKVGL